MRENICNIFLSIMFNAKQAQRKKSLPWCSPLKPLPMLYRSPEHKGLPSLSPCEGWQPVVPTQGRKIQRPDHGVPQPGAELRNV